MHLVLELRAVVFITAGIFMLIAILLVLLTMSKSPVKGPSEWASGNFLSSVGLSLFGLDTLIPDIFSISISNFLITLGLSMFLLGVWRFRGKPFKWWLFWSLPLFSLVQSFLFTDLFHLYDVRRVLFSLTIMVGAIILARETMIPAKRPLSIGLRITAISSSLFALIMLLRALASWMFPIQDNLITTPVTLVVWLSTVVVQIANSFGFLFMFLYKQAEDLKYKMDGMNHFFSILAHDLRGPVGMISSAADELAVYGTMGETEKMLVSAMQKSSGNTFGLLENLLEWGRNLTGDIHPQPSLFSLTDMLKDQIAVVEPMIKSKEISMINHLALDGQTFGDEKMIQSVARNLLTNAIKFSPVGGSVTVLSGGSAESNWFSISDQGEGISAENLKKIRNQLPTASSPGTMGEKGSGLGLSLCFSFIEKNNGKLIIDSRLNKGTTIRVELPKQDKDSKE